MEENKLKRKKRIIRIKRKVSVQKAKPEINVSEFEKRKLELKKQRKLQRLKRKFIIFLFFVIAFAITVTIFKAPFFNIKDIVCVGQERLTEEVILNNVKIMKGNNIFITNLGEVKERLAAIPYVSESNARRIFPDKIKVWVRECVPAFIIKNGNKFAVCDVNTKVLELVEENKENLCTITFSDTEEVKEGSYLLDVSDTKNSKIIECIKTLENLNMIKMTTTIDFTDISDIIILYDNRLKIKLGNTNDISYKLKFISEVIKENISDYEKATIDYTGDKLYVGQFENEKQQNQTEKSEETTSDNVIKNEENKEKVEHTQNTEN